MGDKNKTKLSSHQKFVKLFSRKKIVKQNACR